MPKKCFALASMAATLTVLWSHSALGDNVVVQVAGGAGRGQVEALEQHLGVSAYTAKFSVHVVPWQHLPLALGASLARIELVGEGSDLPFSRLSGPVVVPEVFVWSPLRLLGIQPYAKLGWVAQGNLLLSSSRQSRGSRPRYAVSGTETTFGLNFSPRNLLAITVEWQHMVANLRGNGTPLLESQWLGNPMALQNRSILVGFEFAL